MQLHASAQFLYSLWQLEKRLAVKKPIHSWAGLEKRNALKSCQILGYAYGSANSKYVKRTRNFRNFWNKK